MEACKLLSVEINRKNVGGKLVSTFDYDTSSILQKNRECDISLKHHYVESFYIILIQLKKLSKRRAGQ